LLHFCGLRFELTALHVLGRYSITWATLPALFTFRPTPLWPAIAWDWVSQTPTHGHLEPRSSSSQPSKYLRLEAWVPSTWLLSVFCTVDNCIFYSFILLAAQQCVFTSITTNMQEMFYATTLAQCFPFFK
jgi:hypothetical protein